jgi:hypothetical protein
MQPGEHERHFSRRQVLGMIATAGGALLIAACGGSPTTAQATTAPSASAAGSTAANAAPSSAPSAPPSAAASASASAMPVASGAASPTTRPASPIAATPGSGASPVVAPARPFLSAGTDLGRMLATLPQHGSFLSAKWGFTFADLGQQLRNYDLAGTTSMGMLDSPEKFARFGKATAPLPLPFELSLEVEESEWRAVVGYDFWQVDRALGIDFPDGKPVRLEGRFDRGAIGRALVASGRTAGQYREGTIYSYGREGAIDVNDPVTQRLGLFTGFTRVVLEEAALASVGTTQLAEATIDVRAGRAPSLLANPDYDALAYAIDPVVGAALWLPEQFYGPVDRNGTPVPPATPAVGAERLPPYRLVGMGMQDDGKIHTMIVALVYEKAEDARTAAPLLRRRLESYQLTTGTTVTMLRDRAVAGEPRLVAAGSRTVVVQPLTIGDERNLNLWRVLSNSREVGFLREY